MKRVEFSIEERHNLIVWPHTRWGTPIGRWWCSSRKFPSLKIPRFMSSVGLQSSTSRCSEAMTLEVCSKHGPTHKNTRSSSPNDSGRLSVFLSCGLRVIKCMVIMMVIKTIKVKTGQQGNGCNNDGNMDLGTKGSLVMSLSQETDKNTCYGEKIIAWSVCFSKRLSLGVTPNHMANVIQCNREQARTLKNNLIRD